MASRSLSVISFCRLIWFMSLVKMAEFVPASELAGGNNGGSPANLSYYVDDFRIAGEMSPIKWYSRSTSERPLLICP